MEEVSKAYSIMNILSKKGCDKCFSYTFSNQGEFYSKLIKYDLANKNSGTKFIPEECKTSSADYRLRLLAGLIDTDGHVDKRGLVTYTTKSERLAKDIQELCRSLGGNSNVKKIKKGIKSLGFIGEYFNLQINLGKLQNKIPLKRPSKIKRLRALEQSKNLIGFYLEKDKPEMVYGFEIDSDSRLYITDNYCVTHNSVLALQICIYWTYLMEKLHGIKIPFTLKDNVIFNYEKLISTGNRLGLTHKYSAFQYDEAGETMEGTKTQTSELKAIRDYLRECGQYNFLNVLVMPEFFDLPKGVAITRSTFLLDVYYGVDQTGIFQRGFFRFYSRKNKKRLYLNGKKDLNYKAAPYNFDGEFKNFYPIDEAEYRLLKQEALKDREFSRRDEKLISVIGALCYTLKYKHGYHVQGIANMLKDLYALKIEDATLGDYMTCLKNVREQKIKNLEFAHNLNI
jgi:hypothetical protein